MSEDDRWFNFNKKGGCENAPSDIHELFKLMEKMMAREFKELSKMTSGKVEQRHPLADETEVRSSGPFVYGYSMTVGPDGKPKISMFRNFSTKSQTEKSSFEGQEEMEHLTDVISADGEIRVLLELPGITKKDIELSGAKDQLTISVNAPERKRSKQIKLPAKVDFEKAVFTYKNGVLDVTLPKTEENTEAEQ